MKTSVRLRTLIEQSPGAFLTKGISAMFLGADESPQLPFLFKVLSFDKPFPLRLDPTIPLDESVERLRAGQQPLRDRHQKPGATLVLSPRFKSFIGFRPLQDVRCFLRDVRELKELLSEEDVTTDTPGETESTERVKDLFAKILKKDKATINGAAANLLKRIQKDGDKALGEIGEREELGELAQKLWTKYPGDPGLFASAFFLNYVNLKRGDGLVIPPNCVQSHLEGDVIECTVNSEKATSRGTKKGDPLNDKEILADVLLQHAVTVTHVPLPRKQYSKSRNFHTVKYETPVPDFSLLNISLDTAEEEFLSINGPTIYVVTAGEVEVSARVRPQVTGSKERATPGPTETVASEGGHVPLKRRGSECSRTGEEGQKEWLKEGMAVFVKPGYEIGFWNRGGGRAEIHAAYCELEEGV
ncbi:hypothetical protein ABW19_dt0201637 [Dactylella cylindrospora]|nr:hypothetical protein ABW19_dt0201637 [Dactylella cylindrospora]